MNNRQTDSSPITRFGSSAPRGSAGIKAALSIVFAAACSLCTGQAAAQDAANAADLVIVNAKVWTGTDEARRTPNAAGQPAAVAMKDGRIVAVGGDAAIKKLAAPTTRIIDGRGRRLIPGMTDSHTHIVGGGFQLARLALRSVKDRDEFVRAVAAAAAKAKKGEWVLGGRWSVDSWENPNEPDKSWLDPVTGSTPVFLSRMDGHQALVNSNALAIAGIDAQGPADPVGGEIQRDPQTGQPTGILKEAAMELVRSRIPDPRKRQRYEAFVRAMKHANSLGITSVHDMSGLNDLYAFQQARKDKTLTLRVTTYLSVDDWTAHDRDIERFGVDDDLLRIAGFKGFMDGSLGSRTAYMREPFADVTSDTRYPRGQLTAMAVDEQEFRHNVAAADARHMQLAVHAIGDEANHRLIDAYEAAIAQNGRRDARHRLEHVQHLHVSDIPRFAKLGLVASMQPYHKADDGRYAEKAIGKQRLAGSYAFRQLLDAGALLCFGSDWPVVTLNPFMGIDSAVNARILTGETWLPSHSVTLTEAIAAYTASPPKAIHRGDRLGTIEVGKLADMVLLGTDPFDTPPEKVGQISADVTVFNGKVVYERGK